MKKYILLALVILISALLQTSFLNHIFGVRVVPNLVLAYSLSLIYWNKKEESLFSAFVGGMLLDALGFGYFGLSSLIFVSFVYIAGYIKKYVFGTWQVFYLTAIAMFFCYDMAINFRDFAFTLEILFGILASGLFVFLFNSMNTSILRRFFVNESYLKVKNI